MKEMKVIIDGEEVVFVRKEKSEEKSPLTLVRTYSAGVHVGELVSHEGTVVKLKNAVRIYRWRGANTLSEVAKNGVVTNEYTRISERVDEITLTQAIELIPVSVKAAQSLEPVWNN